MNNITTAEILKLSAEERLELIGRIWDTIGADSELPPVTDRDREELDRRLAEAEATLEPAGVGQR